MSRASHRSAFTAGASQRDSRRSVWLSWGAVLAAAAVLATMPESAHAGTATASGGTMSFSAVLGETNHVSIRRTAFGLTLIADSGVGTVTAGMGCLQIANPAGAACFVAPGGRINVDLGDGDDRLDPVDLDATLVVEANDGNDTIAGGPKSDNLDGGPGTDTLTGGAGPDTLTGGDGDDVLVGGEDGDQLSDGPGNDQVDGGSGIDRFEVGVGTDTIVGGTNEFAQDRATYSARTNPLALSLDGVANDGEAGEGDNLLQIESVEGGTGADVLTGSPDADALDGGAGNDTIGGGDGDDRLRGSGGDDAVAGGQGGDEISAGGGVNVLDGGAGNDSFEQQSEDGTDTIGGGTGQDSVNYFRRIAVSITQDAIANDGVAGENDNVLGDIEALTTNVGDDTIVGGPAANSINSGGGNDTVDGGPGDDVIGADSGSDRVAGGAGDDELDGGTGADLLGGGTGDDTVTYEFRDEALIVTIGDGAPDGETGEGDIVSGDVENAIGGRAADRLVGSRADNLLVGGRGNDILAGGRGNDQLEGEQGDDTLTGARGTDTLLGGFGNDRFLIRDGASDDVRCGGGRDRIVSADRRGARRDATAADCEVGRVAP